MHTGCIKKLLVVSGQLHQGAMGKVGDDGVKELPSCRLISAGPSKLLAR